MLTLSGAVLSTTGLIFAHSFSELFLVLSLYAFFIVPVISLIDRTILANNSKEYGRIRLWGSVGYGITTIGLSNLHVSDFWLGSSWIFRIIPEIITFYFLDRYAVRISSWWSMIIGVFMYSIRLGILSCFPVLWVWIASQPVYIIGFCFWYYGAVGSINALFKDEIKSKGYAVFWIVTYGIGAAAGSLIGVYIVKGLGIYALFGIYAVMCCIGGIGLCLSFRLGRPLCFKDIKGDTMPERGRNRTKKGRY